MKGTSIMGSRVVCLSGALLLCCFLMGCNIGSKGPASLSLDSKPATVQAASVTTFSATIVHNNGKFLGATWTLTSGGSSCSPGCGTLGNSTNSGSAGQGDTATIDYTAPSSFSNSVTITAKSVENPASTDSDTFTVVSSTPTNPPAVATSFLPSGAVGVTYITPPLAATGGTSPYTWSLSSAASTFPAGLTLGTDGSITGSPTTSGTFNFTVQVADSANATAAAPLTISVSASGTANVYIGTQSQGDVWLFVTNSAASQFSGVNQTTGFQYAGTTTLLPNGFVQTTTQTSSDPNLSVGSVGYGVEVAGVGATFALAGAADKPVALVAQGPCPTFSTPATAQLINLGKSSYDSTASESYATVTATQTASTYNFNLNSYLLDGTLRSQSGPLLAGTCTNGIITVPNVPQSGGGTSTVTAVAATNGLYIIDLGPGKGSAVGSQNFVGSSGVSAALANNFLGFLFKRNSVPITTFVGFGPGSGSGTSITGGAYANITTDAFASHATDVTLDLSTVNTNGFLQGTIVDGGGTHTPFVGMVSNNGGKVFIFGITTDTSTTTPYAVILIQP